MNLKRIFVVIPAYNEGVVIQQTLQGVLDLGYSVVVIDDGSSDNTYELAARLPVHVLRHPTNLGQGAALATGLQYALSQSAQIIVTFDADGQHAPEDIPNLLAPIQAGEVEVCLGSRFLPNPHNGETLKIPWRRKILLKAAILFTGLTEGIWLSDVHNGLRAFSASAARQIRITQNRMAHASEIISEISRLKLKYCEIPVQVRYTAYARRKGQKASDALNIMIELLEERLP